MNKQVYKKALALLPTECEEAQKLAHIHVSFMGGDKYNSSPYEEYGYVFLQVGRNSTHQFYVGIDDRGKLCKMSMCCETFDMSYSDIERGKTWGYVGHFY
jgi:hypothetical protein